MRLKWFSLQAVPHGVALSVFAFVASAIQAEVSPLSFGAPEVTKLDWGTRSMTVSDLNVDGLNDLVLINNDKTQIQILLQRATGADGGAVRKIPISSNRWDPVLEDARFDKQALTIGYPIFDLAVGDLNADGLPDLAYSSGTVPLSIRFQEPEGRWSEATEYDAFEALGWPNTMQAADIDGDGDVELVLLAADSFRVLGGHAASQSDELSRFFLTGDNPFNLLLEDVDGDGLKDVLYITASGKQALNLRTQMKSGDFGPEIRFPLERPYRMVTVMPNSVDADLPTFCAVDARGGSLEFFNLRVGGEDADSQLQPEVFPLFPTGRNAPNYTVGDLDSNGTEDLIVSNPSAAELYWFSGNVEGGFAAPKRYPTFTEVSSQSIGHFYTGHSPQIVTMSSAEKIIGLSSLAQNGRVTFPQQMELPEGDPLICEVLDWDHDGLDELAVLLDVDGVMEFVLLSPLDRNESQSGWSEVARLSLGDWKRAPTAMQKMDLFGESGLGLMLFVAREAPMILRLNPNEAVPIVECATDSSIRQSFLKGITPAQVTLADLDGDGLQECIVARTGYARSLKIGTDGIEMVDQFNARRSADVVTTVIPEIQLDSNQFLGLYLGGSGELQLLQRDADGVYRYSRTEQVGTIDLVGAPVKMFEGGRTVYLLFGKGRFWFVRTGGPIWNLNATFSHETDLENVSYTQVGAADFNQDGIPEIVAVDGQNHVVEILQSEGKTWRSLMYWEIFEQNMHYQGRSGGKLEPRELQIAELTGDSLKDFIFLIHDRILMYPQE